MSSNTSERSTGSDRPPNRPHVRLNSRPENVLEEDKDNASTTAQQNHQRRLSSLHPIKTRFNPAVAAPPRKPSVSSTIPSRKTSAASLVPPTPPMRSAARRYRDFSSPVLDSPVISSPGSVTSSRRSSIDSQTGFLPRHRSGPFDSPMLDSKAFGSPILYSTDSSGQSSRAGYGSDKVNTQTVAQQFTIVPAADMLVYPGDVEKDDWLHNPMAGEKESRDCDIWTRRGLINVGGLGILVTGLLLLFIGYPILTFVGQAIDPLSVACKDDSTCIRDDVPLLKNVRTGPIDPDTPKSERQWKARDGSTMDLVFSDEFNTDGRTFYQQDDAYFQAMDLWYGVTYDLQWYDPDAVSTGNGTLNIQFDAFENHDLSYRSGMIQSWNQFCFKGGYIEASISLPGRGDTIGFWPGFWTMGNLGRPGYQATTDGMWPYSYHDECDYGITPNQSSSDGISWLTGMRTPGCTCPGTDHPSPGKARSSPEIDAIEASVTFLDPPNGAGVGSASQSFQLAPMDVWYQPNYDFVELYDPRVTQMNEYRGGPIQQAFSGLSNLNNDWYDGKEYQTYGFEYEPGADGYLSFYIGGVKTWTLEGKSIGPNGNVGQRLLPVEPMSIIANFGMSKGFSAINATIEGLMPAIMRMDYIRLYQKDKLITCDPPGYPTTEYIANHPLAYQNREATDWRKLGYEWPTNSFMDGC